jgi:hypothetical protein
MNISHGCYSDSLGNFDALRLVWSVAAGYGLIDNSQAGGPVLPNINYSALSEEDLLGEWPNGAPEDPLLILLAHDERAGRIKHTHCPYLADRLEQLEGRMMSGRGGYVPVWVLFTQQFIRGLRSAAAYKQDVVFS